ncbi:fibronectin type III domain-containing protein [candidate division TA06 bacterium]|nr:fibronectin type III domain-containing protein [candidate division TA06 bacterium]
MRGCIIFLILFTFSCFLPHSSNPQTPPSPPTDIKVFDTPNDAGRSVTITWKKSLEDTTLIEYEILRFTDPDGEGISAGKVSLGTENFEDKEVEDGVDYFYLIRAIAPIGFSDSEQVGPVRSKGQLYDTSRTNVLIGVMIYSFLLLYFIYSARKGKELFVRKIAGLDAIDEAIGRATEMGKPILFVPGISVIEDVATLASLNILSRVARKTADYKSRIIIPNRDPIVMPVCREVVREAYLSQGRPDAYREDDIYYVTYSQFGYASAVSGIMVREKPATNLFLGMFYAESLILAETGASTGAIQIAGTDAVAQLPFFITACDYTLIGEELYAASAYLSKEPMSLGSLKGQDWAKIVIGAAILIGILLTTLNITFFTNFFTI